MKYLLLLVLAVAGTSYAVEKSLRGPRFERGKLYKYDVEFNVTAGVLGLSSQVSAAVLRADAYIFAKSDKEFILKIQNVMASGSVKAIESKYGDIPLMPNRDLEQRLSSPITFRMEDGMVKSYTLSRNENLESKKIKKSILRSLHMYIPESAHQQIDSQRNIHFPVTYNKTEDTEYGTHITKYMINTSPYAEFPYERNVYNISRFENFEEERYPGYKLHHNFQKQGCAEVCRKEWNDNTNGVGCPPGELPHQGPVKVSFSHHLDLSPIGNTLSPENIRTIEVHYAKMYDQDMEVLFRYRLTRTRVTTDSIPGPSGQQTYTDLFDWDSEINEKEIEDLCNYKKSGDYVSTAGKLLTEIARLIVKVELENYESTLLGEKVILLRDLLYKFSFEDFQSFSRSFVKAKAHLQHSSDQEKVARQVWLNILPVVGTTESIKFIAQYVKDYNNLLKWEIKEILEAIPMNIERPSEEHIKELREITRRVERESHHLHSAAYLTLGRVIGRTCRNTPVVRSQPRQWAKQWTNVQSEPSSNWYRSPKCPEGLVHEIVEEITRNLKNTHKAEEITVYIETLSHIGTFEVLRPLEEYIFATAENLQDSSPRFIDFTKTMALYSLHNIVGKYPEEVLNIVYPVYFNETEAPKVRNAAFSVMIRSQPSVGLLEEVATRSWFEQSLEVGSYVTSTLESFGNSSLPCMKLTADRIKQVFPHVKRFDVGMQHAKNHYFTYFDNLREFGLEKRCELVPNNESYVPSVLYSSLSYSMHSLKEVIAQFALNGEGLTQENIMEKINEYIKVPAIPTIENEAEVFGDGQNGHAFLKPRIPEGPRFTWYGRLFYQSSYLYLDSKSYRRVQEDMAEVFTQYLRNDDRTVRGYLIKLMIPSSYQTVAVPKTLPYPVEFHMSQPLILAISVKSPEKTLPSTDRFNLQVKPRLYMNKLYTHQVKNLGDCKEIGVYHEQKLAVSFPFQIKYEAESFPNVTIKYKVPASQRRVFSYFTESGTYAGKKELERLPSSVAREPIRTLPSPFKFEETLKVVGLPPLHVQLNTEDINIFSEKLPRNLAEVFDIATRKMLNAGWRHTSMNITVLEDSSLWSADTEVTFKFRYHQQHVATSVSSDTYTIPIADEDSWSSQWSSSYQPHSYQPNRQQSSNSWGSEDADWIKYFEKIPKHGRVVPYSFKDPSTLAEKGKNVAQILESKLPHIKHVLDINLETAPQQSRAYFRMEYNRTYNETLHSLHVEAASKLLRNKYVVSFDHVIGFWDKPDEFVYDSEYGNQKAAFISALTWTRAEEVRPWERVKIAANGQLFYESNRYVSEDKLADRVDDKYFLPENHEECLRHVRGGYPLSEECVKAIREYSIYNKLNMNVYWQEDPSIKKFIAMTDFYLQHALFEYLNYTFEENNKNSIQLQMNYIDKFVDEPVVDFTIREPYETVRFEGVPTKGIQPLSSVYNHLENYFLEATNNTYLPSCTVMENYIRTYDLETYPFTAKDCHYVLSTHCTRRKNFAVILHGKQEINIHVGHHTLVLSPRISRREPFIIKFNGHQHKVYDVLVLDPENEIYAYVENYTRNHEHITVVAERVGLKVTYDNKNIKVMVHPNYKGELCGLCSEFDGEYTREFRGMDRCLYQDYLDFANSNLVKRSNQCQPDRLRGKRICDSGETDIWQRGSTNHEDYEPTTKRNFIVNKGSEICFSVHPVPVCEGDDPPTETEPRLLGFHCLPKRDVTARKLEQEAKFRPLEELERKSVDYEETVQVAKLC